MSGLLSAKAKALEKATPTTNAPTRPGAYVTAIASMSFQFKLVFEMHSSATPAMASICFLLAISGTTPPKRL